MICESRRIGLGWVLVLRPPMHVEVLGRRSFDKRVLRKRLIQIIEKDDYVEKGE